MKDLEEMVDDIHRKTNPKLRLAVRELLDSGVSPAEITQRYGLDGKRVSLTACAVESFIAEWLKEVDAMAAELEGKKKKGNA